MHSISLVFLSSCRQKEREAYDWIPTVGAPEEYPVKIISGQFISSYGYSPKLPQSDFINAGWGNNGSVMAVGRDKKPVPDSLEVTWLSFAENQSFSGKFALPTAEIAALLKSGFIYQETNAKENYSYITLGFSPGGHITLWLSGGPRQILVDTFKAEPVKLQRKDAGPDDGYLFRPGAIQDSYIRNVPAALRAETAKNGINFQRYTDWQKKYQWKYKVNDDSLNYYHILVRYFNEESEEIFGKALHQNALESRAVPKHVNVVWFDKKQQRMSTEITFNEAEIRSLFSNMNAADHNELYFTIDPEAYKVAVSLKTGDSVVRLTRLKEETFLIPNKN